MYIFFIMSGPVFKGNPQQLAAGAAAVGAAIVSTPAAIVGVATAAAVIGIGVLIKKKKEREKKR